MGRCTTMGSTTCSFRTWRTAPLGLGELGLSQTPQHAAGFGCLHAARSGGLFIAHKALQTAQLSHSNTTSAFYRVTAFVLTMRHTNTSGTLGGWLKYNCTHGHAPGSNPPPLQCTDLIMQACQATSLVCKPLATSLVCYQSRPHWPSKMCCLGALVL